MSDHYRVLGVPTSASDAQVRAAYVALARKYHPDFHTGDAHAAAEEAMQRVNEAWGVLRNPERRSEYDRSLKFGGGSSGTRGAPQSEWVPFDTGPDPDPADFDDRPIAGAAPLPRSITMAPAAGVAASVLVLAAGTLLSSRGMITLAVVGLAISLALFFLVPLFALSRAERDPEM